MLGAKWGKFFLPPAAVEGVACRTAFLCVGLWVVPVLAQRASGFREVIGWKYGWGRDPGEKCVARRKYLEAAEGGH